jgi:alpha-tubulin suppressor-like RCC1 family protein
MLAHTRKRRAHVGMLAVLIGALLFVGLTPQRAAAAITPGTVAGWGDNGDGQIDIPDSAKSGVIAISAGDYHSLALKSDGSVIAWGNNGDGRINVPDSAKSEVVAIAAGYSHNLALKEDGSVIGWGSKDYGEIDIPDSAKSGVIAISAGIFHSMALKEDGSVVAWGFPGFGQKNTIPASAQSDVVAISDGYYHSIALKNDGSVVAWGQNDYGETNVPDSAKSGVVAISSGDSIHNLALKDDGTIVAWGDNAFGQNNIPASAQSDVIAISDGFQHSMALKRDGSVVDWGDSAASVPADIQGLVTAIDAGAAHGLALYTIDTTAPTTTASTNPTGPDGTNDWFKSNVTVDLNAIDNSGKVKSITYSLNGGAPTTVNAASTSLDITTDGTTTLDYYATDDAGNTETAKTLTIQLDTTPPTITVTRTNADGSVYTPGTWTNQSVTVTYTCSDVTSGFLAANSYVCGATTIGSSGLGTSSIGVSDVAGNSASAESGDIMIDKEPPSVIASAKNADGTTYTAGSWTNQNVTVSFSCSDSFSGLKDTCPAPVTISAEGTTAALGSGSISDNLGNTSSASFGPIQLDKTAPTVTATASRAANSNGWYNASVSLGFSGVDNTGGSGGVTCDAAKTYSGPDSATASMTGNCTDAAGNVGSATATFPYDATRPTVTYSGNAGTYTVDQTITITCLADDNLSGIASTTCATITGPAYSFALGSNTRSASATDKAGNTGSGSTSFTVGATFDSLATLSVRFSANSAVDKGLSDKLAAAKAAAAKGDTKTKNNNLNAYRQQVSAQSGKALTKDQATMLINLSKSL